MKPLLTDISRYYLQGFPIVPAQIAANEPTPIYLANTSLWKDKNRLPFKPAVIVTNMWFMKWLRLWVTWNRMFQESTTAQFWISLAMNEWQTDTGMKLCCVVVVYNTLCATAELCMPDIYIILVSSCFVPRIILVCFCHAVLLFTFWPNAKQGKIAKVKDG